jgi:hypothetical protein
MNNYNRVHIPEYGMLKVSANVLRAIGFLFIPLCLIAFLVSMSKQMPSDAAVWICAAFAYGAPVIAAGEALLALRDIARNSYALKGKL